MLGQDEILENIQGLIQGQVGVFLQLKSQLQEMSRSPVLTISDKANQLLVAQNQLETELPNAIAKSQTGSTSDIISASGFFIMMEKQIHDVGNLREEYASLGDSAKASLFSGIPDWILYATLGIFALWTMTKRKGKY